MQAGGTQACRSAGMQAWRHGLIGSSAFFRHSEFCVPRRSHSGSSPWSVPGAWFTRHSRAMAGPAAFQQPAALRALGQPTVLGLLGAFRNGVPDTPREGDWRDYMSLCSAHRDIQAASKVERHARRMANAYKNSEDRKRWAEADQLAALGYRRRP